MNSAEVVSVAGGRPRSGDGRVSSSSGHFGFVLTWTTARSDIPLSARIVAVGDVYDALRSRRVSKTAISHPVTMRLLTEGLVGQFDPTLVEGLRRCAGRFEHIFRELAD